MAQQHEGSQCCWEEWRSWLHPSFPSSRSHPKVPVTVHIACTSPAVSPRASFAVTPIYKGGVCETPWGSTHQECTWMCSCPKRPPPMGGPVQSSPVGVGSICLRESLGLDGLKVIKSNHKPNTAMSTTKPPPKPTHFSSFCHLRKSLLDPGQAEGDFLFCFLSPPQFWTLCAFPKQGMMSGSWKRIAPKWNGLNWKGP